MRRLSAERDEVYARLMAEGEELMRRQAAALEADTSSDVYREYVARLHAHIAALAEYLGLDPPPPHT